MSAPPLGPALEAARHEGRTVLIPYVMAGLDDEWLETLDAVIAAGADAVEIGLPFSDPIIDGPVIQEAGRLSLARGTTAEGVLGQLAKRSYAVPLVAMTYYNVIGHLGLNRFAGMAREAGVSGAIIADLSLEELDPWEQVALAHEIDPVLLVAPSTPAARADAIVKRARGFIYAVATMGVTGERAKLSADLDGLVAKIRHTDGPPVCVGVGVSTPEQAAAVGKVADGVIVGSALIRRLLAGEGPQGAGDFVASLRGALSS